MRAGVASTEAGSLMRGDDRRVAGLGVLLFIAAAVWTVISWAVSGGEPVPLLVSLALPGSALLVTGLTRGARPWLVPAVLVGFAAVLLPVWIVGQIDGTDGPWGYANANGAFFVQATAAAVLLGTLHRVPWSLVVSAAGIGLFGAVAVFSSIASAIGIAVVLASIAFIRRPRLAVVGGAGLVGLVLAATVGLAAARGGAGDAPERAARDALSARRVNLWSDALVLMGRHPGFGVGPGRFAEESPTARADADARWAHQEYLQLGAEIGAAGLIVLILLFLWGFTALWIRTGPAAAVAAGALAAVGLHSAVDYVLHFPAIPVTAAALLGTALAAGGSRTEPAAPLRRMVKAVVLPMGVVTRRRPGDVVALLYHRVGTSEREIELPVETLERQVAELAEDDRVLTIDQVVRDGDRGGVVVTFDDGYRDFHDDVLPLLERYRVPAVLYLATGLVAPANASTNGNALTWSALRDVVSTGLVTIGAHTHSHADLSAATAGVAEEEMRRSKELVEDQLDVPCRHFAYPFAVGSPAADRVARRLFDSAALDAWRTNRRGQIDPHRLGRTPILRSDGHTYFRAKVRGWLDGEGLAYRFLGRGPWRRI
jgi:peptidoglycan/xylan/chitin deacetylase (PgdA/CDA1 family)